MPARKRRVAVLVILAGLGIIWSVFSPHTDSPRGRVIWSLATVRWPGGWKNVEATRAFFATSNAVYIPMGVASWQRRPVDTGGAPLVALAADALGTIAAGSLDGRLFVSNDGGLTWTKYGLSSLPISSIQILNNGAGFLVSALGDGLFEINRGVYRATPVQPPDKNIWCLLHPDPLTLIAFTASGAYESTDAGENWRHTGGIEGVSSCSQDGHGNLFAISDGDLLVSHDRGRTTGRFTFMDGTSLQPWSIATDSAGDAVVGTSSGTFWTRDGGQSWKRLQFSKNPIDVAANISLVDDAWAQMPESGVGSGAAEVPSVSLPGPTLLPPIGVSLNPQPGVNLGSAPFTGIPQLQTTAVPSQGGPNVPANSGENPSTSTPSGEGPEPPGPDGGGGGPPPTNVYPFAGITLACSQDSQGTVTCPSAALDALFTGAARSASMTMAVDQLLTHNLLEVTTSVGREYIIEKALQQYMQLLMARALVPILAFARANASSPAAQAVARADTAYVARIRKKAVQESIRNVNPVFTAGRGNSASTSGQSRVRIDTSGTAFHQLTYSSIHGAGWWN